MWNEKFSLSESYVVLKLDVSQKIWGVTLLMVCSFM
jgi:hypothetical protein